MFRDYTSEDITQFKPKEQSYTANKLTDADLSFLRSLIAENSRQLDKYISELKE